MQNKSANKQISFDAGIMKYDVETKKVTPDSRRGRFTALINNQGEKHIEWMDLNTKKKELDLFVFENDAKFSKVVKSTGRVYLLHFESYDDKYFFWIQEKEAANDSELCKKVNDIINFEMGDDNAMDIQTNEPMPANQSQNTNAGGLLANVPNISNISNERRGAASQQQQQQQQPVFNANQFDLNKMIQEVVAQKQRQLAPPLSEIFNPQVLDSFLQDPDYQNALIEHLPDGQKNIQGLRDSLKSAQLLQALDSMEEAINSEEIRTVLISLGLDPSVLNTANDGTDALLKALQKWVDEKK